MNGGLDLLWEWRVPLAWGALSTVAIAFFAYSLGMMIGLAGAMGKLTGGGLLRRALDWYTTVVRSLPELLLIIVLYYLVSDLINQLLALFSVPPIRINGFVAAIIVLGYPLVNVPVQPVDPRSYGAARKAYEPAFPPSHSHAETC